MICLKFNEIKVENKLTIEYKTVNNENSDNKAGNIIKEKLQ